VNQSEQLQDLYLALSVAQGEIENAAKESENPGFKRGKSTAKYADLASIRDAYRLPFAKNGLALIQLPATDGRKVTVMTRLAHKSGQFIEEAMSMTAASEAPHAIGSALTYIRRYAALCFTGIAPEDDDGNAASQGGGTEEHPTREESREPHRDDTAEFDLRRKAKADYAEFAKITWDTFKSREDMSAWYAAELLKIKETFDGKEDLAFVSFVEAFKSKGATLPEKRPVAGEKPSTDAIPDTPSNGKPRPSLGTLRMDLRLKLSEATTEEGCNAAYASLIEPYEDSLKQDEQVEMVRMTKQRIAQIKP
jgi:hypothetical protein